MFSWLPKMVRKIGTHNGNFHVDEALACFMIRQLPEFSDAEIVRSREEAILNKCDIVVDVGGVYDHAKLRYDHHQREFQESMSSVGLLTRFTTKLSSAGLVYAHYGKRVLGSILNIASNDPKQDILFEKVYEGFIEEIDAGDNGIAPYDGIPRYHVSTTLAHRVAYLNPSWNSNEQDYDKNFLLAVDLAGRELVDRVQYYHNVWLPARDIVKNAVQSRFQVDDSGRILEFQEGGVPWKDNFFHLEEELGLKEQNITYVIFSDISKKWRLQAVPVSKLQGFDLRLPLPEKWRGLRGPELAEECGVEGAVFCHVNGFICGNNSREGVLRMARKALQYSST